MKIQMRDIMMANRMAHHIMNQDDYIDFYGIDFDSRCELSASYAKSSFEALIQEFADEHINLEAIEYAVIHKYVIISIAENMIHDAGYEYGLEIERLAK